MRLILTLSVVLLCGGMARADVVKLRNGGEIEGTVLQETPTRVAIRMAYGTVSLERAQVASIERKPFIEPPPRRSKRQEVEHRPAAEVSQRFPDWRRTIDSLAKQPWAAEFKQIPATVVDKGVFRNIPYTSYRAGEDYEINVYGDPDAPAGIEIGIYRGLIDKEEAKRNCIDFVAGLLSDSTDVQILRALSHTEDSAERKGLTLEVTPPTAEDAYGGWWVSVYDKRALDGMRASDAELAAITVARAAEKEPSATPSRDVKAAAPPEQATDPVEWTPGEMRYARPVRTQSVASPGSGRVYVRGYYRKDGTYVRAHTRRR